MDSLRRFIELYLEDGRERLAEFNDWLRSQPNSSPDAFAVGVVAAYASSLDVLSLARRELPQAADDETHSERETDVITVMDTRATILFSSSTLEDALGIPPAARVGRSGYELLHPDDRPLLERLLDPAPGAARRPRSATMRFRDRFGAWQPVQVSADPIRRQGTIVGFVVRGVRAA